MRCRDDCKLRKFIEEDIINSVQEKRSELREKAKNTIENIQRENRTNYNRKLFKYKR